MRPSYMSHYAFCPFVRLSVRLPDSRSVCTSVRLFRAGDYLENKKAFSNTYRKKLSKRLCNMKNNTGLLVASGHAAMVG